jgi:hypothetical protein
MNAGSRCLADADAFPSYCIGDLVRGARTVDVSTHCCAVAADKYLPMAIVMRVDSRSTMYM